MSYSVGLRRLLYIVALTFFSFSHLGNSQPACQVQSGRVNDIRLGGSIDQVFRAFQSELRILEEKPQPPSNPLIPRGPHLFHVIEKAGQKKWITFAVNSNRKIISAYVEGPCPTKEGIGVGSSLGQAIMAYGRPELSPSDLGYYVGFEKIPFVEFLLSNEDIPNRLRGIADDELGAKQEKEILSNRKARITKVRLTTEEVDR